jgi:beta-glucanase (GH16 family)
MEYYDSPAPAANITENGGVLNLAWTKGQSGTGNDTSISTMSANGATYKAWSPGFYVEVSMAFDPVSGSWPAIWMLGVDNVLSPSSEKGELDILEWQSQTPTMFNGTVHDWRGGQDVQNNDGSNATAVPSGTDFTQYHTYAALMTPTTVTWYFDNKEMHSYQTFPIFNSQLNYLIIGDQMGCNWSYGSCSGGTPSSMNMKVQWVHVFQQ